MLKCLLLFRYGTQSNAWQRVCESVRLTQGGKLRVRLGNENVLLMRTSTSIHACQAHCPHLGVALADGYHDETQVFCPAHGLAFGLESGQSSCAALRLRTYEVEESLGEIWIRASQKAWLLVNSIGLMLFIHSLLKTDPVTKLNTAVADAASICSNTSN